MRKIEAGKSRKRMDRREQTVVQGLKEGKIECVKQKDEWKDENQQSCKLIWRSRRI